MTNWLGLVKGDKENNVIITMVTIRLLSSATDEGSGRGSVLFVRSK